MFTKDLEEIKKSQDIMNNTINEIRNTLEATNSRVTEAENKISEIEDRLVEINESERKQEKQIKRNKDNLRDLQDNMKHSNIRIIGVPEEEDRKKDHEKILEEIIVENFPKMGKEIITQVQETQRVPNRINPRQNTPRHILIKLTKIKHKEQILKAAREKQQITHKGIPIRITADLSIETLQARREWQDILKVMKDNNLQPRLLYPARISFKYEGEIKSFTDKQKLREFSITKPALQQLLKDILQMGNTKRVYKPKPKTINGNRIILINNYLKRKWVECPNQKTKIGRMDTKTRPLYMLSTRDLT